MGRLPGGGGIGIDRSFVPETLRASARRLRSDRFVFTNLCGLLAAGGERVD
jgi:hypothetical protein